MANAILTSSTARPLRMRMRADLSAVRQQYQGRSYWVVKDPLTLKYFRFQEEEYAILRMLDGQRSLDEIRRKFEREFPPEKISFEEISHLVGSLHRSGLVLSSSARQGEQLARRRTENTRRETVGKLTNVMSMQFRGFDPDGLLTWLNALIGWMMSPLMLCLSLLLCVSAGLLILVEFETFSARLPAFGDFFAAQNWLALALTLAATKVLHELGHGLACKRLGGQCHEMGVMFLVMTPCLYVNVSDSWMLPNRWHRAAIGAAGMYVEFVLASICVFLWYFSEPGLLNYLALNIIFVCSVSTLLFNANPLLRFDGYYILSDLTEIPNLRSKASTILRRKLGHWLLGLEPQHDPFLPQRNQWFFALFTVAAAIYRWVVSFSILWFLYNVFKPYGLQVVGQLIAVAAMYGLFIQPLWQFFRFLYVPGRVEKVSKLSAALTVAGFAGLVAVAMMLPLPYHVECPFFVEPRDTTSVIAGVPGQIEAIHVQPGAAVEPGSPILSMSNVDIRLKLTRLRSERERLMTRMEDLRRRQYDDQQAAIELVEAEKALTGIDARILKRSADLVRLKVVAPSGGVVLARPPKNDEVRPGELASWNGTPLEAHNLGAAIDQGELVCRLGDPAKLKAVIDVDQSQIEFVRKDQPIELKFDALPGDTFITAVGEVAELERHARAGDSTAQADAKGRRRGTLTRVVDTKYQASAALNDKEGVLYLGATGTARIRAGSLTLGQRAWRYLSQTFRFSGV